MFQCLFQIYGRKFLVAKHAAYFDDKLQKNGLKIYIDMLWENFNYFVSTIFKNVVLILFLVYELKSTKCQTSLKKLNSPQWTGGFLLCSSCFCMKLSEVAKMKN